jgi:hypothetical protein
MGARDVPLHVRQRVESKWAAQRKRMERQGEAMESDEAASDSNGLGQTENGGAAPVRRARITPAVE